MSNVLIYNPDDIIVINKVTSYLLSVNTPDYDNVEYKIINPDISSISSIPMKYWKVENDLVVEMTSEEKNDIDNFLLAKTTRVKKYNINVYENSKLSKETWYDTDNGDGTYKGISEETIYTYSENTLLYKIITSYYFDGSNRSIVKVSYYKNENGDLIEKREVIL